MQIKYIIDKILQFVSEWSVPEVYDGSEMLLPANRVSHAGWEEGEGKCLK